MLLVKMVNLPDQNFCCDWTVSTVKHGGLIPHVSSIMSKQNSIKRWKDPDILG